MTAISRRPSWTPETSVYFFGREKKKDTREKFSKILGFWAWNKKSAREKNQKTPKKYPWKSFFARENFRKFTPVKTKKVGVKKIKNTAREKSKSARENCHFFLILNDGFFA